MKRYLIALVRGLVVLLLGGVVPIFLWMGLLLFGSPTYVLYAAGLIGMAGLAALALAGCGLLEARGKRRVKLGFMAVCLGAAVYVGCGVWRDRIPTLDDRTLLLQQYQPGAQDSWAVRLEEEPSLKLDGRRLPSMDGATALYPVYAAFAQAVYPEGEYPLYGGHGGIGLVACCGTAGAYRRLTDRDVDVVFAAAPSQAQREEAEAAGLELHMTPIGREAFVFFVNSRNPVEGLTVDQVKGTYIPEGLPIGGRWVVKISPSGPFSGRKTAAASPPCSV